MYASCFALTRCLPYTQTLRHDSISLGLLRNSASTSTYMRGLYVLLVLRRSASSLLHRERPEREYAYVAHDLS